MGLLDLFRREKENRGGRKIDISNSHTAKVLEEKKRIENNADKLSHILLLCEKYPLLYDIFSDLHIEVKYSNPVVNDEIVKIDEEISNKLDDIKLMLSKSSIKSDLAMQHAIRDLKELIHKRETKE